MGKVRWANTEKASIKTFFYLDIDAVEFEDLHVPCQNITYYM